MNIKAYLAAFALCALPLCSQAGVIYEWTAANDDTPWGITLQLEFDRPTVNSGAFTLNLDYDYHMGHGEVPRHGLIGLRYTFPGMMNPMDYSSKGRRGFDSRMGSLRMDLKFIEGGFLTGNIYANDTNSHIDLASIGEIFTVLDARSDEVMPSAGCGWPDSDSCNGAAGYIRSVREVPEPASITLLALGAAALARSRGRKSATNGVSKHSARSATGRERT